MTFIDTSHGYGQEPVSEGRKISVTFERKKDLGDYSNTVARAWIEDTVPADATDAAVSGRTVELLNAVKAGVLDSLGIEVFMDDTGVLREKHAPIVSVQAAQSSVGAAFAGTTEVTSPSDTTGGFSTGGLRVMNPDKMVENIPQYIIDKCVEKNIGAVWANDGQYGPFYKEAVKRGEAPMIPDSRDPAKAGIIKSDS